MRPQLRIWLWYSAVVDLLVLDQVTKALARHYLPAGHSIPIIGDDFLRLTHVLNPGSGFGVRYLDPTVLLIFGWAASAVLAVYLYQLVMRNDPLRLPIALFLAGAVGNSIDRLFFGQVTDFIDMDFPDFIMDRWPVYNVADSCITVGIVALGILVIWGRRRRSSEFPAAFHAPTSPSEALPSDHRTGPTTPAN